MMLNPFYVIPGYTFFYWGFTIPQREYKDVTKFFKLKSGKLSKEITLLINGRPHPAKIRIARITTENFPNRNVVQIFYDRELDTLKALRKLFIYSYASTINKSKPLLKELMEVDHIKDGIFKIKVVSKQKTDFDNMFNLMEDKNLFAYWKSIKEKKPDNFFIDYSRHWVPAHELKNYANRVNVIYILYNSRTKQLYVGKANRLGERVKVGEGRIGLAHDWDKFMFFEIQPKYNPFIEQIEAFMIRTYAALLKNDVGVGPLNEKGIKLVNKQLKKK